MSAKDTRPLAEDYRAAKWDTTSAEPSSFSLPSSAVVAVRVRLNWTQKQLAVVLGVTERSVARWEAGHRTCRGLHAERLAQLEGRVHAGNR